MISVYNEKWFKFLIWSTASLFFFINSCLLICTLAPAPSEGQIHLWMSGMMQAMEKSMMAFSMQLEEGSELASIMYNSSRLTLMFIIVGLVGGLIFRQYRR